MPSRTSKTPLHPRATKIVCTLGPASSTAEQIEALAKAGMNVARINLSHGARESHAQAIGIIDALNASGHCIAVMIDTRGSEIRTGEVIQPIPITEGQEVLFSSVPGKKDAQTVIEVNYDGFARDVRETDEILVDNGDIEFQILSFEPDGSVRARAKNAGSIGSRRHINLPGADIDLPSLTKKDWDDIAFGAERNVDYVALSFIRSAEEIDEVRAFLAKRGSPMRIITKIETRSAVEDNLAEIVAASDGIMVARGDLGTDIPIELLPAFQDEIVTRCQDAGKPVIIATHMLESMSMHPMPTRAEVTDVAHAAIMKADATMLSGETATGKYPVKCVQMMDRILRATEEREAKFSFHIEGAVHDARDARAEAAVTLARSTESKAFLVFTRTGKTALSVAKFRATIPLLVATPDPHIQHALALVYGVTPLVVPFADPESTVVAGLNAVKHAGLLQKGDTVVLVSDTQTADGRVSTVQVREVM